jgi:hypothetical protein
MELERQENVLVVGHQVCELVSPSLVDVVSPEGTGYSQVSVSAQQLRRDGLLTKFISYAYFHNLPQADLPYIKIPLHTVIKLTPKAYGCDEER